MYSRILAACLLVVSVGASGCIGVSTSEKVTSAGPSLRVAVVDDEIYLVDVEKRTAYKVRMDDGQAVTAAESPEDTETLTDIDP